MSKANLDAFALQYRWERAGVTTASRLLAMKRPDVFVCIDSENRSAIARAFSLSASSLMTFEGYWDLLLRIWKCPWYRSPCPTEKLARRIWNARVALLDCVYYYF